MTDTTTTKAPPYAPLPGHLDWLTERVEGLVRPAAFLRRGRDSKAHQGATRSGFATKKAATCRLCPPPGDGAIR